MSIFVSGVRPHDPACRQRAGHPPVLCVCRSLPVEPVTDNAERADVPHTRVGSALLTFFRPIDRNAA